MLDNKLPPEIINIIYKMVHKLYMKEIRNEINYCLTWVRLKTGKYSFLIGQNNYYRLLL